MGGDLFFASVYFLLLTHLMNCNLSDGDSSPSTPLRVFFVRSHRRRAQEVVFKGLIDGAARFFAKLAVVLFVRRNEINLQSFCLPGRKVQTSSVSEEI